MSKFKVGDVVEWREREWYIQQPFIFGGWMIIAMDNKYSTAIVTDNEIELIKTAPEPITVYAVCDDNGKNPSKVFMFKENALNYGRLNLTNYTIRPYALTPINE